MKTGYIIGLALGHNASTCLIKDGQIVFSVEEERLTRLKADGAPLRGLLKVLDYTNKVDYIAITYPCDDTNLLEYTREHLYFGMARKLGLTEMNHKQELSYNDVPLNAQTNSLEPYAKEIADYLDWVLTQWPKNENVIAQGFRLLNIGAKWPELKTVFDIIDLL